MRWGVDGRTIALGLSAVFLALGLGAWAGTQVGAWAGALAALAGLLPPAVLAVAVERRQRNAEQMRKQQELIRKQQELMRRQQEILRRHAPPKRTGDTEGQD